jgi:hypothetical protein
MSSSFTSSILPRPQLIGLGTPPSRFPVAIDNPRHIVYTSPRYTVWITHIITTVNGSFPAISYLERQQAELR